MSLSPRIAKVLPFVLLTAFTVIPATAQESAPEATWTTRAELGASVFFGNSSQAAVTTAGDVVFGLALDNPPPGWRLANPVAAKEITARLLAGKPVGLEVEAGDAAWITGTDVVFKEGALQCIRVTDRLVADPGKDLVLHPPVTMLRRYALTVDRP